MKLTTKLVLPIALSLLMVAPASAKKPTTFLGKMGASILQTINEHSFLTSCVLTIANNELLKFETPKTVTQFLGQTIVVVPMTLVETTLLKALTKNFEIDPIQ